MHRYPSLVSVVTVTQELASSSLSGTPQLTPQITCGNKMLQGLINVFARNVSAGSLMTVLGLLLTVGPSQFYLTG